MRFPFSDTGERGTWRHINETYGQPPVPTVVCPNCGTAVPLSPKGKYDIEAEGLVFPALSCPNTNSCSFYGYVELADWATEPHRRLP